MLDSRIYRDGVADAITGQEFSNPYTLKNPIKAASFFNGFMDGKAAAERVGHHQEPNGHTRERMQ